MKLGLVQKGEFYPAFCVPVAAVKIQHYVYSISCVLDSSLYQFLFVAFAIHPCQSPEPSTIGIGTN